MLLEVKDLAFSYPNGQEIFNNVCFTLDEGEIFIILGPNGAGKSTLLNCLSNLLAPTHGQILLNGTDIHKMPLKEVAKHMGYVPQTHVPAFGYSVRDFIVMGRAPYLGMMEKPSKEDYAMADEVMERFNLTKLADKPYTEISGGERQQATIARAITQQPKIIMFDEPTNHLDYGNQLRTIKMIKELAKEGYAIIMTTHMPDHAIILKGKAGILDGNGNLVVGPAADVLNEETLKRIYNIDLYIKYIPEVERNVCIPGKMD